MASKRNEHYMRGLQLYGENRHREAIEEYRKALELSPDWTEALHGISLAHMHLGELDDAIRVGQRIVELDPDDAFAHTSLSMFFQRKGMIPEAENEAAKARMIAWKEELKKNPNAPPPGPPGGMNVVQ
ncbi:MAG TPA: tetratricopeptide repeat protein [Planctomycetota bacterium]|nr:tetratricopeptide repeat protein [Planctomycetota bacterium]